jgi:hypothetical protein
MNIDWTQQPGLKYVWLEISYMDSKDEAGWFLELDDHYKKGSVKFSKAAKGIKAHHKPTATPYQSEVGVWCEYLDCNDNWNKCFYVGVDDTGKNVFSTKGDIWSDGDKSGFRPIKTEREQFIQQCIDIAGRSGLIPEEAFGKLYSNGARFNEVAE